MILEVDAMVKVIHLVIVRKATLRHRKTSMLLQYRLISEETCHEHKHEHKQTGREEDILANMIL